jgi:hypothetical protein
VPEIDPYVILGVPRTATREAIARAYRSLAKRYHPDAGATPSLTMSRINEAWWILSNPSRRAQWDRAHAPVIAPHWVPATAPAEPMRRPPPRPKAPPSRLDSGWIAAAVVLAAAAVIGVAMLVISTTFGPVDPRLTFASEGITFRYPDDWTLSEGHAAEDGGQSVIAHLTTYGIDPDEMCLDIEESCTVAGEDIPAGEASIVITEYRAGTPLVTDPVTEMPAGLEADAIIGGEPAAYMVQRMSDGLIAWWQLSPPGFPDRWMEVRAEISGAAGPDVDDSDRLGEIWDMVGTIEFDD